MQIDRVLTSLAVATTSAASATTGVGLVAIQTGATTLARVVSTLIIV